MTTSSRTSRKRRCSADRPVGLGRAGRHRLFVSTSIRAETDRAGTAADGLRAMYLATGSVDRAMQWLLWGTGSDRFFDRLHYSDKPRLYFSYPSGDVVVEMMPEAAKLDINHASGEDLVRLVTAVSGDPAARPSRLPAGFMAGGRRAAPTRFVRLRVRLFSPGVRLLKRSKNYCWCTG